MRKFIKISLLTILTIAIYVILNTYNLDIYTRAGYNFLLGWISNIIIFSEIDKE